MAHGRLATKATFRYGTDTSKRTRRENQVKALTSFGKTPTRGLLPGILNPSELHIWQFTFHDEHIKEELTTMFPYILGSSFNGWPEPIETAMDL